MSGASLVLAMWTPLKVETKKASSFPAEHTYPQTIHIPQIALTISCLLFLLHAGLAVGFKVGPAY